MNGRKRLAAMHRQAQVELSLRRLTRLATLQREYGHQLNEAGLRLLRASTFTAYCDCRTLGVIDRARSILAEAQHLSPSHAEPTECLPLAEGSVRA